MSEKKNLEMQAGVYMLVNAFGREYLFLDVDSSLEDVVGFAKRYNQRCETDNRFVALKYKEGKIDIQEKN